MSVLKTKKKLIFFLILILLAGSYFGFKKIKNKNEREEYVFSKVEKGTIVLSVSGSGQVSAKDQVDIRSKVSGEIEKIFVEKDESVKKGQLLLKIKTKDFERAIDDAELALKNAKTSLENMKLDLNDAKSKLENLLKNEKITADNLENTFEDAFLVISNIFGYLPSTINDLKKIFTESSYGNEENDMDYYWYVVSFYKGLSFNKNEKENKFLEVKEEYEKERENFVLSSRISQKTALREKLKNTLNLIQKISDLTKEGRNIILLYKDLISKENITPPISLSITESQLLVLEKTISQLDKSYSDLVTLSQKIDQLEISLANYRDQISLQQESIKRKEEQIELQKEAIKQKEDALEKAKENYENCFIKANFDGKITAINPKEGDSVSQGTALFTLITHEKIIEISLNEIDAAKIKVGQKASLTFDAIPDLTLTGKVIEVDTVGTVSQGVVSYGIKIALDSDDERIKPSMSVNAEIIVNVKSNVLVLPNSAIKTQGNLKYVELIETSDELKKQINIGIQTVLPKEASIRNQIVETGISNDSLTEIISGINEGEVVISSKISSKNQQNQNQVNQFRFQIPGMQPQIRR